MCGAAVVGDGQGNLVGAGGRVGVGGGLAGAGGAVAPVPGVAGDGAVGVGRAGRVDGQAQVVLIVVVNAAVGASWRRWTVTVLVVVCVAPRLSVTVRETW